MKELAANQCLLDYWKPYFEFVEDPVKLPEQKPLVEDLLMHYNLYIHCGEKRVPHTHSAGVWIQTEWNKQDRKPLLQLKDEHRQRGWEMLEKMGIPKDAWFVTNHVRESWVKNKESYRDSDISTYF